MSPIPGIWASQISGHLWAPSGAYDAIASTTLSATAASITFSGIPSTYTHLQLRWTATTNRSTYGYDGLEFQFNGDTNINNYTQHGMNGNGASAAATGGGTGNIPAIYVDFSLGTTVSNYPGTGIADILDYANTNKYKTVRALGGADLNGTIASVPGRINFASGLWLSTSAVNSITFFSSNSTPVFAINTQFALYGIR